MPNPEKTNGLYGSVRRAIDNPQVGDISPPETNYPIELAVDSVWQLPGGIPAPPKPDLFARLSQVQLEILDLSSRGYGAGEINHEIGIKPDETRRERESMIRIVQAKSMTHAAYLACVANAYDNQLEDLPGQKKELTPVQLRILWFEVNGRSREEINAHFRLSRGSYEQNIAGIQSAVNGKTLPNAGRIAFEKNIIPSLKDL